MRRVVLPLLFVLAVIAKVAFDRPGPAATPAAVTSTGTARERPLALGTAETLAPRPGTVLERALAPGAADVFTLALDAGTYFEIVVEQLDLDVVVRLDDPAGEPWLRLDSPTGGLGAETLEAVTPAAGIYTLAIEAFDGQSAGRYRLVIAARRPATEADRARAEAAARFREGERLRQEADYPAALERHAEALERWRAMGDPLWTARTLERLGRIHFELDRWPSSAQASARAAERFAHAAALLEEGTAPAGSPLEKSADRAGSPLEEDAVRAGSPLEEGYARHLHGRALLAIGELDAALDAYAKALALRRAAGDRYGEALTLSDLARCRQLRGDTQEALGRYREALAVWRELGAEREIAVALHNLGALQLARGRPRRALDLFEEADAFWTRLDLPRERARTLDQMGQTRHALGDPHAALALHAHALALRRRAGDRRGLAVTAASLATVRKTLGETEPALDAYNQALEVFTELGDRGAQANVHIQRAALLDDPAAARAELERALALYRAAGRPAGEAATRMALAELEQKHGDLRAALRESTEALAFFEDLRRRALSQALRVSYFATLERYHARHVDLLMALDRREPGAGWAARALEASERARARSLIEILGTPARVADSELVVERRRIQARLNDAAARRRRLLAQGGNELELAAVGKTLRRLTETLHELRGREAVGTPDAAPAGGAPDAAAAGGAPGVTPAGGAPDAAAAGGAPNAAPAGGAPDAAPAGGAPAGSAGRGAAARSAGAGSARRPAPLDLETIRDRVLDDDTALLEYALGEERSFVWLLTRDELATAELPPRETIETAARDGYRLLVRSHRRESAVQSRRALCDLSRLLLAPIADRLGDRRLLVVASGALQYLPFSALPDPRAGDVCETAPPLLLRHEIVTLPSASTLGVLRRALAGRPPPAGRVAVLADPVYRADDPRVGRKSPLAPLFQRGGPEFERLPFSRREAEAILAHASAGERFVALDFDASKETATGGRLAGYRILHFATHGLLDAEHPDLSSLVLSRVDRGGRPRDGRLYAHEIHDLALPAELVVLSACRTALGREMGGEGMIGLPRAFLHAGAARVVVSLWNLGDRATAEIMERFYRHHLGAGLAPAAALRRAQIETRRERPAPYHWAGFIFQGEWRS